MRNYIKILSIIMATIFVLGLFSSCVNKENTDNTDSDSSEVIDITVDTGKDIYIETETKSNDDKDTEVVTTTPYETKRVETEKATEKAKETVREVSESKAETTSKVHTFGGDGSKTTEYSCGTEGHNCRTPESHAYLVNLEKSGCQLCHKTDCPAIHSVDQWGNIGYDYEKCPEYTVEKDPCYYCQTCHKKAGDGSNGTCVQFLHSRNCPNCGEYVNSMTCHTCK